jgi:hypothetical protein
MRILLPLFLILHFSCVLDKKPSIEYYPIDGNAWHIELDISQGAIRSVIYATFEGRIVSYDPFNHENRWEYETGAFIFQLKVKDIDRDGHNEILAVNADNQLLVLDHAGKLLWEYRDSTPLYDIDAGEIDTGTSGLEIITGGISRQVFVFSKDGTLLHNIKGMDRLVFRLQILNLDEDDQKEILVIENRTIAHALKFGQNQFYSIWRKQLKVPAEYINWENPRGSFYPFSITSADLQADGDIEIIGGDTYFNKQAVGVFDKKADPIWISEKQPPFENRKHGQTEFYSTAFIRTGDLFPEMRGIEILSVAGGNFRILSEDGNLLGEQEAPIGFTDFEIYGRDVYLSSSPNGDNNLYHLKIDENWQQSVQNIERRGKIKRIGKNLQMLEEQVLAFKGEKPVNKDYFIKSRGISILKEDFSDYRMFNRWFRERFPYTNLKQIVSVKVIESTPPLDENGEPWSEWRWSVDAINGTMTVEEILAKAKWIEENQIPTLFNIGHSCMPFITLETAEKILQTAPNYCIGFQTSEDENLERIPRFFRHYFGPLADLCVKYGYKLAITKNKGIWWLSSPAHLEVYNGLFSGERKKVVVAATEDSNSRTPEINLLARGGFWQAGLIRHNEVSIHADLFSFNRFFQWEYPKTGSPYLRLLVAHTSLGMTMVSTRISEIFKTDEKLQFNKIGEESTEIFYHMLGKGIVFSPDPADILGYNSIGFIVHQPQEKWLIDAHNGHAPEKWEDDEELHKAVIPHNGCLWGITLTPDHALQAVLFNKNRQFGYQLPPTPYGLIAFIPEFAHPEQIKNIHDWWHTDGISIWKKGGEKLSGISAAEALRSEFEKSASELVFRVQGEAFLNTIRLGEDNYRLYLIDPGWLDPADRNVMVRIQKTGYWDAIDILSGEKISTNGNRISTTIPAGSLRIIDVNKRSDIQN